MFSCGPKSMGAGSAQLIVVSNRRPFTMKQGPKGPLMEKSAGGLVAAVYPLFESIGGTWVAWDGDVTARGREGTDSARTLVPAGASSCRHVPVQLSSREVSRYYYGFANRALWPLSHLFIGRCHFDPQYYREYERVNSKFARTTQEVASAGDRIWVHDYHLALVPQFLRERDKSLGPIGFFWHIPFPPWDVFRVLPWRRQILEGILGADIVGFHLEEYAAHFREAVRRCLGLRQERTDIITDDGRRVAVAGFPIGIDVRKIESLASSKPVVRRANQLRERRVKRPLVLSVDRLDYSKGILDRLTAVELFLERFPEWRGKVDFEQLAVPSRTRVDEYRAIKRHVEEAVGRINGRFGGERWVPVRYLYRAVPLNHLIALYRAADVAMVTPLRDGMNLVAMEYVASQVEQEGALVLSELAGVAGILSEGAFIVNPFDHFAVANAINAALLEPAESKRRRMEAMQEAVRIHDVFGWHTRFWRAHQVSVSARLSWLDPRRRLGRIEALGRR